jgi:hypothetical protein
MLAEAMPIGAVTALPAWRYQPSTQPQLGSPITKPTVA